MNQVIVQHFGDFTRCILFITEATLLKDLRIFSLFLHFFIAHITKALFRRLK